MARRLKNKAVAKAVKGPVKKKRKRVAAAELYDESTLKRFAIKGPYGIDWYLVDWPTAITLPGNHGEWYAGRFATLYSSTSIHMHDADLIVGRVLRVLRPDISFSAGRRKVCHAIARWALFAHARWWLRCEEPSKRGIVMEKCRAWANVGSDRVAGQDVLNPLFVLAVATLAENRRIAPKLKPGKTKRTKKFAVSG